MSDRISYHFQYCPSSKGTEATASAWFSVNRTMLMLLLTLITVWYLTMSAVECIQATLQWVKTGETHLIIISESSRICVVFAVSGNKIKKNSNPRLMYDVAFRTFSHFQQYAAGSLEEKIGQIFLSPSPSCSSVMTYQRAYLSSAVNKVYYMGATQEFISWIAQMAAASFAQCDMFTPLFHICFNSLNNSSLCDKCRVVLLQCNFFC